METTCTRCHQTVQADNAYCPACGLPQLVYSAEAVPGQAPPERFTDPPRDASTVEWKPALRLALMLAVPAGLLSSGPSPLNLLGLFWMAAAASWAVVLYMRSQRPAWITIGAGARIGLVTGLLGAWFAFAAGGGYLFVQRYFLHQSGQMDAFYKASFLDPFQARMQQSIADMGQADAAQMQASMAPMLAWMRSPIGHAGVLASGLALYSAILLMFAIVGGALGARLLAPTRTPSV
ncbi:MAG: hypothetical protein ABR976_13895 [Terracidiphilus sp.]|jgi:hypothetical protein